MAQKLQVQLQSMSLVHSSSMDLDMLTELGINNTFGLSIDDSTVMKFGLNYNGSNIGYVKLNQFQLINDDNFYSNVSSTLSLRVTDNEIDRIHIDELLGRYVSGLSPKITSSF
ncbi:unnamed protein product [Ambrosiozyma monospora]|uniref:Unnamed protein product n=1 Tax=Ambrosiozyma monospora TaxID=43982 RepID=A0ACB5UF27_AMBMO|nr:unnamed protein product [Ambrosiozyma monospora]